MKTTLNDLLNSGQPIILDGATGTMLFDLGLQHGDSPELWNVTEPEKLKGLHHDYIEAGSQIILTNTFGCNSERLKLHNLEDRVAELNVAGAKLARDVVDASEKAVVVAGDMGPTGSILFPYGELEYDDAVAIFEVQARALAEGGVDVFWIETMSDLEEVRAAVEGCRKAAPEIPVCATMTFDTHGRTMMGVKPEQAVEALAAMNLAAIGGNCGNGTGEIEAVIEKMHTADPTVTLIAKSNAGIPTLVKGVAVYDASPEDMGVYAARVMSLGATIIGGCCGSTPDHIREIAASLRQPA
ncbi:MAG: betaine--homocysteine S-methyltransferase [Chloroflexota bacterium]